MRWTYENGLTDSRIYHGFSRWPRYGKKCPELEGVISVRKAERILRKMYDSIETKRFGRKRAIIFARGKKKR